MIVGVFFEFDRQNLWMLINEKHGHDVSLQYFLLRQTLISPIKILPFLSHFKEENYGPSN